MNLLIFRSGRMRPADETPEQWRPSMETAQALVQGCGGPEVSWAGVAEGPFFRMRDALKMAAVYAQKDRAHCSIFDADQVDRDGEGTALATVYPGGRLVMHTQDGADG